MIHLKPFHLFSFIILASFIHTDLLALRCTRKCGNVIIISTIGKKFLDSDLFHLIMMVLGFFLVAPLLASTWTLIIGWKTKKQNHQDDHFEENGGNLLRRRLLKCKNPQLKIYSDQQIQLITTNYKDKRKGTMSCCTVDFFIGSLLKDDGEVEVALQENSIIGDVFKVAVVEIKRVPQSHIDRFVDQLMYLSQTNKNTSNLVRLIGCCLETQTPRLVYALHGDDGCTTLSDCARVRSRASLFTCEKRVKAAAGVARGFASFTKFMHGNVCSANIVMDGSFDAKIFYAAGSVHEENDMYTDPEFVKSRRFNNKSDVYSFGVVLVELLTGHGDDPKMVSNFVNLAKAGRIREILVEDMRGEGYVEVVGEVAALAQICLNVKPRKRPTMEIVEAKLIKHVNDAMKVPRKI